MTSDDGMKSLITEIDRQLLVLSTTVRISGEQIPRNVVTSLPEEGNGYRNYLSRLRKVVLELSDDGAPIGSEKHQLCANLSTFLWKIPTFSSPSWSFVQPEVMLQREKALSSLRRQGNNVLKFLSDTEVHPALSAWASHESSKILIIRGSSQSTKSLGYLSCEIVNHLLGQSYATIYILNTADIREKFKSLGASELLRQIACQLLRIITTDITTSLLVEILRLFHSASSVNDWFCILERIMHKMTSVFVIIDASVLQNLAKEVGQWIVEFNDLFNRLGTISTACVKVMILTNRQVKIDFREYLHAHIESVIREATFQDTSKLATSQTCVKLPLRFFAPTPTQVDDANNAEWSPDHVHDGVKIIEELRTPLQYGPQSNMTQKNDALPRPLQTAMQQMYQSTSNLIQSDSSSSDNLSTRPSINYQRRQEVDTAIICALSWEADAVEVLCDYTYDAHDFGKAPGDSNTYNVVRIGRHKAVILYMPAMGKSNAAACAMNCLHSFPNIRLALLTGICGGIPSPHTNAEILLGDVIISDRIVLYDFGRRFPEGFERKDSAIDNARKPLPGIAAFLSKLKTRVSSDRLSIRMASHLNWLRNESRHGQWATYPGLSNDVSFESTYHHKHHNGDCEECETSAAACTVAREAHCALLGCDAQRTISRKRHQLALQNPDKSYIIDPVVHFGAYASGDIVMKSGQDRDEIGRREKIIAFEMEGAGIWDNMPTIIVKGVCDYADSHKNKDWQKYAATTAAACVKALLEDWAP